jgi:hypothetical protein
MRQRGTRRRRARASGLGNRSGEAGQGCGRRGGGGGVRRRAGVRAVAVGRRGGAVEAMGTRILSHKLGLAVLPCAREVAAVATTRVSAGT